MKEEPNSKREALALKKLTKFQEVVAQAEKLITPNDISQTLELIKDLIAGKDCLDSNEFKGVGNIENWRFLYPEGPF